jgi:hypothetical protein
MNSECETECCLTEELHPSVQWIQAVAFEAKNCRTNKGTPALRGSHWHAAWRWSTPIPCTECLNFSKI